MRLSLLSLCVVVSSAHAGPMYVCEGPGGTKLYSQMPCPAGQEEVETREYKTQRATDDTFQAPDLQKMADDVEANNRRLRAEREIKKASVSLNRLEKERDKVVANQLSVVNSIAGTNAANRQHQAMQELEKVSANYDARIAKEVERMNKAKKLLLETNSSDSNE